VPREAFSKYFLEDKNMEQIFNVLFLILMLSSLVVTTVWNLKFKKTPDIYLIISFTLMGIISIVNALISKSEIGKGYMLAAGMISLFAVVFYIVGKIQYKKAVKEVQETVEYHKQNAERMAEETAKEIEQMIEKDEK
jgi:prepilin signal peptidase PulO-like enzyme (type II secretory pathway)